MKFIQRTRHVSGWSKKISAVLMFAILLVVQFALPLDAASDRPAPLRGIALVIGNNEYEHLPPLANPENDALAIYQLLNDLGFETVLSTNRDARRLKRDLEDFVEDSTTADVALIYYAGHGIEAGGENWLVPTDANLDSLNSADKNLVSFSSIVERLQKTVPVVIMLLDACRDNPFPKGSLLRLKENSESIPVSITGLGEIRGATTLSRKNIRVENLGTVIGFAAEPGRPALDGEIGQNSPYAAALLRHLETMNGEEFGMVMRMVAEEVYLKTSGRQRPWINEHLRRLLFFGIAAPTPRDEEGQIVDERRQLLIKISSLDRSKRQSMEAIASSNDVPLDAIFAMLNALGEDAPSNPLELDRVMSKQVQRVKQILDDRAALTSTDPEIRKLSNLADKAIDEGAVKSAVRFLERAKIKFAELELLLDRTETELKARRMEAGSLYAKSAETYLLAFKHLKAAEDFARAHDQVARWDNRLAWQFKYAEMASLSSYGIYKGDNAVLKRAIKAGTTAIDIATQFLAVTEQAKSKNTLADTLLVLGQHQSGTATLERAAGVYQDVLLEPTRERVPLEWVRAQLGLGNVYFYLGQRQSGTAALDKAADAFRASLEELTRERAPLLWARAQQGLANVYSTLGQRQSGTSTLEQAADTYFASLEELTRDRVPLQWAEVQYNLGIVYYSIGQRRIDTAALDKAADAFRASLEEFTREKYPAPWAMVQSNLGLVLTTIFQREQSAPTSRLSHLWNDHNSHSRFGEAEDAFAAALKVSTRDKNPLEWARIQSNYGLLLSIKGELERDRTILLRAVQAYKLSLTELTRDRAPLDWATMHMSLGSIYWKLGLYENDIDSLHRANESYILSLKELTLVQAPQNFAIAQYGRGNVLLELGLRLRKRSLMLDARDALTISQGIFRSSNNANYELLINSALTTINVELKKMK